MSSVEEGSAAAKAGVRAGAPIVGVNGVSTVGVDGMAIKALLKANARGTRVLAFGRPGTASAPHAGAAGAVEGASPTRGAGGAAQPAAQAAQAAQAAERPVESSPPPPPPVLRLELTEEEKAAIEEKAMARDSALRSSSQGPPARMFDPSTRVPALALGSSPRARQAFRGSESMSSPITCGPIGFVVDSPGRVGVGMGTGGGAGGAGGAGGEGAGASPAEPAPSTAEIVRSARVGSVPSHEGSEGARIQSFEQVERSVLSERSTYEALTPRGETLVQVNGTLAKKAFYEQVTLPPRGGMRCDGAREAAPPAWLLRPEHPSKSPKGLAGQARRQPREWEGCRGPSLTGVSCVRALAPAVCQARPRAHQPAAPRPRLPRRLQGASRPLLPRVAVVVAAATADREG